MDYHRHRTTRSQRSTTYSKSKAQEHQRGHTEQGPRPVLSREPSRYLGLGLSEGFAAIPESFEAVPGGFETTQGNQTVKLPHGLTTPRPLLTAASRPLPTAGRAHPAHAQIPPSRRRRARVTRFRRRAPSQDGRRRALAAELPLAPQVPPAADKRVLKPGSRCG